MAQHARWFATLPSDELNPLEHQLRKILLKTLNQKDDGVFPLGEWIDRRVGGELESRRDVLGNLEICLRGAAPPPKDNGRSNLSKKDFFATLASDAFAPPEEALRDACYEFLASWRSSELATLHNLENYPGVLLCINQFLPRSVTLRDWIQHRIGGEIEFRKGRGAGPGSEVVHLTDAARETVVAKYHQLAAAATMMPPPMGFPGMPPHMAGPPPPGPPPGAPPPAGGKADKVDKGPSSDAFFSSLPGDELLPDELALREALLDWLNGPRPDTVRNPPHLSDTEGDAEIKWAKAAFLPKSAKFAEWIERRIGGEVELRTVGNGQVEIYLRGDAPPEVATPLGETKEARVLPTQEERDAWFDALPQDEFSPEEEGLREALLNFLEGHSGPGPAILGDAAQTQEVLDSRKKLLPKGGPVRLQEWIDRRIGGELETRAEGTNKIAYGKRGELPLPGTYTVAKKGGGGAAKKRKL